MLDFNANCVAVADFEAEGTTGKVVELTNDAAFAGSEATEKVEEHESHSENFFDFMGLLQNLKLSVTEMVGRVSNYLQNFFSTAEKGKSSGDATGNVMDYKSIMGGSFIGLAVLVIMVVLVKRA